LQRRSEDAQQRSRPNHDIIGAAASQELCPCKGNIELNGVSSPPNRIIEQEPEESKRRFRNSAMTDQDRQWVFRQLKMVAGVIGEGVGKTETEIVKKLREEIVGLRAEIEILRQHKLGFDLLALDADDLRKRPLVERKSAQR
jgi:hypothetical protein